MKPVLAFALLFLLGGCQPLPARDEGVAKNAVFLKSEHCLNEYVDEQKWVYYGPCLKVTSVNGSEPAVRPDGFIEVPVRTRLTLGVYCVYRSQDGSYRDETAIPATVVIREDEFTRPGQRWYLHPHTQALRAKGCKPTLSRAY